MRTKEQVKDVLERRLDRPGHELVVDVEDTTLEGAEEANLLANMRWTRGDKVLATATAQFTERCIWNNLDVADDEQGQGHLLFIGTTWLDAVRELGYDEYSVFAGEGTYSEQMYLEKGYTKDSKLSGYLTMDVTEKPSKVEKWLVPKLKEKGFK